MAINLFADEEPRCVANEYCCSAVQPCDPGEGFCNVNSDCSSGSDGTGRCQKGSCNTTVCSPNTGKCFTAEDSCCVRQMEGKTWSEWSYSDCSATCGSQVSKTATRTCISGCSPDEPTTQTRILACQVDDCLDEPLTEMCPKPLSVYNAAKFGVLTDCVVEGEYDPTNNMINGEFDSSLQDCMVTCNATQLCAGFSYHFSDRRCVLKTSFELSDVSPKENVVSGSNEACLPWILLLKHDSNVLGDSCPLMFDKNGTASLDPSAETPGHLYSNLDQLKYLRGFDDKFHLKMSYPRAQNYEIIWKQTSDPSGDDKVDGFELIHGEDFPGLSLSDSDDTFLIGDRTSGWFSVGHRKKFSKEGFTKGFPGPQKAMESSTVKGEVTWLELKSLRHFEPVENFTVTASSASDKAHFLIDGLAFCNPSEALYYKSSEEAFPRVEIDLKETRVVKGVVIFLRSDQLAPPIQGS